MKAIFCAVLGATFCGLVLALLGLGWEQELPMWRERLFAVSLNGVFAGWLAGLVAYFAGAKSAWRGLLLGVAFAFAPWSWFTAGLAIALVAFFWRRPVALPRALPALGLAAHLVPALVFFGMSPSWSVIPTEPAPALAPARADAPMPAPGTADVLFVVCDTLRADAILDSAIPTPVLDSLRARGVWASYATAPANQTLPSHLSLLTGFEIEKIGMRGNLSSWPSQQLIMETFACNPLALRFEAAGYRTAAVSTNTLLTEIPEAENPFMPFDIGFQTWHGLTAVDYWRNYMDWVRGNTFLGFIKPNALLSWPMGHLLNPSAKRTYRHHHREGERTTDAAIAYLADLQKDARPYFLFAQYFDPHTPYAPSPEFVGTLAKPSMLPEGYDGSPISSFNMRVNLRAEVRGTDALPEHLVRNSDYQHALYREEVAFFDQQLGRLLEAVAATGRPTIIAFTADHGEGFGLHGNVEHGESLFEAEIAVPFILVAPDLAPRQLSFAPQMLDNARTLLSLAGIDAKGFDGIDVLAANAAPQPAMSFMIQRVSMREGNWKLHASLQYSYDHNNPEEVPVQGEYELVPEFLFDLGADPLENINLLETQTEVVDRLVTYIHTRMKSDALPAIGLRELSPAERAQLQELGYIQ